jgi:hypothetical protein
MPDEVRLNEEMGIIEVNSYGVVTKDDILGSIEKIQQIQSESGIDKLLVDTTRQETLPSPIEIFELFSVYPREIKTALLVNTSQTTAKDVEFVETVALNRGKHMKVVHDREQALQWLDNW